MLKLFSLFNSKNTNKSPNLIKFIYIYFNIRKNYNIKIMEKKNFYISKESPIMEVIAESEFNQLENKEKNYSYYLLKGCWEGTKICYFQKSYESPALFYILQHVFSESLNSLKISCYENDISREEWDMIIRYCAAFIQNCGNYRSFGDVKFIPEVSEEKFLTFIKSSKSFNIESNSSKLLNLWNKIKYFIFKCDGAYSHLGLYPKGLSGYYSHDLENHEILLVDEFLQVLKISPLNTRIGKFTDKEYVVLIASANLRKKSTHFYKDVKIQIQYGDFSPFLRRISNYFEKASEFTGNSNQKKMIDLYLEHFYNGDIEVHKESQRVWVKDISPIIESNIGFIETYADPIGVRAEFEGWVAVVDKEQSKKTSNLVDKADNLLKLSPWPREFEKDKFLKPDFTSLSVLAFGCGGTPLGINIPNYDDIRQEDGFKNVHLGNCILNLKKVNYLDPELGDNIIKYHKIILFFKVAFHELLGHGCGKLLRVDKNGEKNFDENLINPVTNSKVCTWYKSDDTWGSIFGNLSNPYEECRADSVALYYSCFEESFDVLLPECKNVWRDLNIGSFTEFLSQGISALEYYNLENKKFTQAHMNGRYVILQVLIEAGNNFIKIEKLKNSENKDWIYATLDKEQILTTGKKAMGDFLLKMNVFKATADFARASEMFQKYSQVNEFFLELRQIVLDNKKPVRVEIQGFVEKNEGNELKYVKYADNFEGIVESFRAKFPGVDEELIDLWNEQSAYYKSIKV